jgi:hypothetical protein
MTARQPEDRPNLGRPLYDLVSSRVSIHLEVQRLPAGRAPRHHFAVVDLDALG